MIACPSHWSVWDINGFGERDMSLALISLIWGDGFNSMLTWVTHKLMKWQNTQCGPADKHGIWNEQRQGVPVLIPRWHYASHFSSWNVNVLAGDWVSIIIAWESLESVMCQGSHSQVKAAYLNKLSFGIYYSEQCLGKRNNHIFMLELVWPYHMAQNRTLYRVKLVTIIKYTQTICILVWLWNCHMIRA